MVIKEFGKIYLNNREQAAWVNNIILPALKKSYIPNIYQYYPYSFADVDYKAKVRKECFIIGTGQPIDVRYVILELCLDRFWAEVRRLSYEYTGDNNRYILCNAFCDLFLVISRYSLKLATKRDTF